ncbi:MAG TPA: diguanylate cyclase [Solirubrobacteraceae bacterium]|nr:diguanylate cyclase [Solirubrobacteraceae bacterium]
MHPDVAPGSQTAARVGAILWALGGSVSFLVVLAPHPNEVYVPGFVAVGVVAELVALALWLLDSRLTRLHLNLAIAAGSVLITADIAMSGEHRGASMADNEMLYVWVALYAAYFFTARQAAGHVMWAAALYGTTLWFISPHDVIATRWIETTSTLAIAVLIITLLKSRVKTLLSALADAARTDPLTGLKNRRGFEESIDVEIERARRSGHPLTLVLGDLDHFKRVNDRLGHGAGDAALSRVGRLLDDGKRQIDYAARTGGEEFALILPETTEQEAYVLTERLRVAVQQAFAREMVPVTFSFGVAGFPHHGRTADDLLRSADRGLYAAKELGRNRSVIYSAEIASVALPPGSGREVHLATLLSLAEALDMRDAGTADHSQTVGRHCDLIARELGLPRERVERVRLAGVLHDIGKIGVSDVILRKPGPLDDAEWAEMRRHPEIGARILGASEFDDVREWVLSHHERPDGRGYPAGLRGDAIPLESRILAVADAYEAMTSDRVYRAAIGGEAARAELRRGAGTQFDRDVVQAFLTVLESASAALHA